MSLDIDYATKLSFRLDGFKVTSMNPYRANFRCPICGDSSKSKGKRRGWFLSKDNIALHFYCHNCHYSRPFGSFLETFDKAIFDSYLKDKLMKKRRAKDEEVLLSDMKSKPKKEYSVDLKGLVKVSRLKETSRVIEYLDKRQIPKDSYNRIYVTKDFNAWVNSIIPKKLPSNINEPRLVFPFLDKDGKMFGFCGRSFKSDGLRYISIMLDEEKDKFFGLDTFNPSKRYYVFEGAIDSLFIENSIAAAGADCKIENLPKHKNSVQIFDNDKHNLQIIKSMEKQIKKGFSICIWPDHIESGNDINDLVMKGYSPNKLKTIIDANIYSGLMARARLAEWRKV